ncbi:MAG: hypothetical protein Q8R78_01550 [Candidatus Omnitrophota bacterium]|nr:hypothetical protein [Candidatus Omnitrophota bacterium]
MAVADILVSGSDASPKLAVEVKNRSDVTGEWASQLRRNLAAHAAIPATPFFMVAVPDHFYVWTSARPLDAPADYVVDARPLLHQYISSTRSNLVSPSSEHSLELAVSSWLNDLVHGHEPDPKAHPWLFESGLYDSIRNGSVSTQARL